MRDFLRSVSRLRLSPRFTLCAVLVALVVAVPSVTAAIKVRTDFEKTFDFQKAKTWGWSDKDGGGSVIMARTADDDTEGAKRRADPIIKAEVAAVMPTRGLTLAAAGATPDLTLNYYVLLTVGTSSQQMGQFLPATTAWGLPIFAPQTTSLEMIPRGSLVLDLSVGRNIVWRGIAEAKIDWEVSQEKRESLLREAVRELLKKYPPKK